MFIKRLFSCILICVMFCSLCLTGCGKPEVQTPQRREDMPKQLLVSDVTSIPMATDDMTYEQRRQLCLDFFEVQLGFQTLFNQCSLSAWWGWGRVVNSVGCYDYGYEHEGKLGEKKLWQQGGLDRAYTFKTLQEENYIPFTFVELLDPNDEQDKVHLDYYNTYRDQLNAGTSKYSVITPDETANGAGVEQGNIYSTLDKTEGSISYLEFRGMSVASNYAVSDVSVTVTDKDGNQLLKNIHRADSAHLREVSMDAVKSTWQTARISLKFLCRSPQAKRSPPSREL